MRHLARRSCWAVGLLAAVGVLLVLNHFCLPSYVNDMRLRNESGEAVTVHYRGTTLFERGSVVLEPGEARTVVVNRGDLPPSGYSVCIEARWGNSGREKSAVFSNIHPRDGAAVVIIGADDLRLEQSRDRP